MDSIVQKGSYVRGSDVEYVLSAVGICGFVLNWSTYSLVFDWDFVKVSSSPRFILTPIFSFEGIALVRAFTASPDLTKLIRLFLSPMQARTIVPDALVGILVFLSSL